MLIATRRLLLGPVLPPLERGWLWFGSLNSFQRPLRRCSRWGGLGRAREECLASMPAPELSSSPTDTHCTHVRVGLLLLRVRVRPTPARCYLPPLLGVGDA